MVFSLGNALGHFDNLPSAEPPGLRNAYSAELMGEAHLSALEVTRGTAQVLEALQFGIMGGGSATGKRRLHLDLGPHSVYLAPDGQWRLGGWAFSLELAVSEASTLCPYYLGGTGGGGNGDAAGDKYFPHPELVEG